MKRVLSGVAAAALLVVSYVPGARAGGMEWPENGTRAAGRGGAFTAKADDPTAIVLNPAGLGWVKGLQVTFDNSLIQQGLCFQRAGSYPGTPGPYTYAGQPYPEVCRNLQGMFYVPMFAASWDFGLKNWTFAIGGYGPHAVGRREFPMQVSVTDTEGRSVRAPGPTRYDVDAMNVVVIFFTLAAAYRPVPWLSLGAALQIVYADVDYSVFVPLDATYDPDGDIRFHIHTKGVSATGIFSMLAKPWRGLNLGLSVRLPVHVETKGDAWIELPAAYSSVGTAIEWLPGSHKAGMGTDLPLALRGGIRYAWPMKGAKDAPDFGDIEFDVVWERWSALKTFDTKLNASLLGEEMAVFALPHHYQDVGEFRLGGSFTIPKKLGGGWLTIRAGWYYGSTASPLEYTRSDYAAWARMGVFGGLSYRIWGVDLHAGFSYLWNGYGEAWKPWSFKTKRTVDRSCIEPINAFEPPPPGRCQDFVAESADISRGEWRGHYLAVSLGVTFRFDELYKNIKGALKKKKQ
ncbi:MAG: outer membrane protein transport protein [bacterium]